MIKQLFIFARPLAPIFDIILSPLTLVASGWFRIIRYWGIRRMPVSQTLFLKLGMIPVVNHYYEPLIDYRRIPNSLRKTNLELRDDLQLQFIDGFNYQDELIKIPRDSFAKNRYYYANLSFGPGDAELYYSIIRYYKPTKILEVGSGFSTLLALDAVAKTKGETPNYDCRITCIEPFEMDFLESINVNLIRELVENVDQKVFQELGYGDILFIDSSHIIRPGGDVIYLILEILSKLADGVLIHFHDIFIPQHYPADWLKNEYRLWNEQYLLEGFLLGNTSFEIVCGLNYLLIDHSDLVYSKFPVMKQEQGRCASSFWLRKVTVSQKSK